MSYTLLLIYWFQIITKGKKEWHDEVDILLRHSQHPHIVTLYTVSIHIITLAFLILGTCVIRRIMLEFFFLSTGIRRFFKCLPGH